MVIDVGTGFYIEKTKDDAKNFYERKVAGVGENLERLEGVVRAKEEGLKSVEEGECYFLPLLSLLSIRFEDVGLTRGFHAPQYYGRRYYRLIADRRQRVPVRLLQRKERKKERWGWVFGF